MYHIKFFAFHRQLLAFGLACPTMSTTQHDRNQCKIKQQKYARKWCATVKNKKQTHMVSVLGVRLHTQIFWADCVGQRVRHSNAQTACECQMTKCSTNWSVEQNKIFHCSNPTQLGLLRLRIFWRTFMPHMHDTIEQMHTNTLHILNRIEFPLLFRHKLALRASFTFISRWRSPS